MPMPRFGQHHDARNPVLHYGMEREELQTLV
jgi:hypothetical protein